MPRPAQPDGPSRKTPITGYTLAVSWSPEFCRGGKAARDPGNLQCNGSIGRFGFVLHGLWPESRPGKPPQWCALTPRPSEAELRANLCMTPVPWLLEHEWAKHGSCMAATPAAYFKASAILWNSLRLPDADRLSRQKGLTAGDLRRAFVARNPQLPISAVGLRTSNGGWLREIHLCYGKDFMPTACDARSLGPRNDTPLRIWRGL
jgi:ribonuclease T2